MSIKISVDTSGLKALLSEFDGGLSKETRPIAQAGAQVLYDDVKANVAALGKRSGKLANAIYQAFSADNSLDGVSTYHVSWNARKAPHGHLVEFGHLMRYATFIDKSGRWVTLKNKPLATPRHVAANPFIRPAMSKFPLALDAMEHKLDERLAAIKAQLGVQ